MFKPAAPEKEHWFRQRLERDWHLPVVTYQLAECLFRQVMARGAENRFAYEGENEIAGLDNPGASPLSKLDSLLKHIQAWQGIHSNRIPFGFHSLAFTEVERDQKKIEDFKKERKLILRMQSQMHDADLHGPRTWIGEKKKKLLDEVAGKRGYVDRGSDDLTVNELVHPFFDCYISFGSEVFSRFLRNDVFDFLVEKIALERGIPGRQQPFSKDEIQDRLRNTKGLQRLKQFPVTSGLLTDELANAITEYRPD